MTKPTTTRISEKLLDEIDYHHTEEGNELRLTKYRDSSFRKKEDAKPATTSLTLSIKTRYSLITAGILTAIIIAVYSYFFFAHGRQVFNEFVTAEKFASEEVARIVVQGNEELDDLIIGPIASKYIKDQVPTC